jgi:hypothetical protein
MEDIVNDEARCERNCHVCDAESMNASTFRPHRQTGPNPPCMGHLCKGTSVLLIDKVTPLSFWLLPSIVQTFRKRSAREYYAARYSSRLPPVFPCMYTSPSHTYLDMSDRRQVATIDLARSEILQVQDLYRLRGGPGSLNVANHCTLDCEN